MGLFFEEFVVGHQFETAGRTVTESDVVAYTGMSGDYNPLHTDEEFARTTPFGTRVAHGPLVLAIAMGLVNRMGMTDGTSLGSLAIQEWRFLGPVRMGDTVKCIVTIESKRQASSGNRGIMVRRIAVKNQRGEIVQDGAIVTMVKQAPVESAATPATSGPRS